MKIEGIEFKDKLTVKDYIETLLPQFKDSLRSNMKLICHQSKEPTKLKIKELEKMEYRKYFKISNRLLKDYGLLEKVDFLEKK